MFEFIANNIYILWIIVLVFGFLYILGGDDIVFFRKKKHETDPKAAENLHKALTKFARTRDCDVIGPVDILFEGKEYHFDSLLLGQSGTMIISLQPQAGEIYGDASAKEWSQLWNGQRKTFANPLLAMENYPKVLRDLYRAEGVKFGVNHSMAVFTNKDCNVVVSRNTPACHANNLEAKLNALKFVADTGANIDGMKAAIEKYKK